VDVAGVVAALISDPSPSSLLTLLVADSSIQWTMDHVAGSFKTTEVNGFAIRMYRDVDFNRFFDSGHIAVPLADVSEQLSCLTGSAINF